MYLASLTLPHQGNAGATEHAFPVHRGRAGTHQEALEVSDTTGAAAVHLYKVISVILLHYLKLIKYMLCMVIDYHNFYWHYSLFICAPLSPRYIFGKSRPSGSSMQGPPEEEGSRRGEEESMRGGEGEEREGRSRTIHKEQDGMTAFCSNKVSSGLIAVSTPREILEVKLLTCTTLTYHQVNMHLLLHPSAWSDRADDEAENDILHIQACRLLGSYTMQSSKPISNLMLLC